MHNPKNEYKRNIVIGKDFWSEGTPPIWDDDLEQSVLGAVLLEYNVLQEIGIDFTPALFFKLEHQIIAEIIIELWHKKQQIDILTVTNNLRAAGKLNDVGGPGYIARLTNKIASSAWVDTHVKLLQEMHLTRSITELCAKTMQRIHSTKSDVFEVYSDLQRDLELNLKSVIHYEVAKVGAIHEQVIDEQLQVALSGNIPGVVTGMRRVDKVTNGWQNTDFIILAARPGMGKTAFVVSCILEPSINQRIPIGVFSLEMSKKQLVGRIQSQISGYNVSRIVKKQLSFDETNDLFIKTQMLKDAPIYIDDTPAISVIELKSKARKLVRENGVKLIIVDYLQLMRSGMNIQNREQEIAEISRSLKALAKELDVPVIALSQLSRSVETRGGEKKPNLSDLRESGQIEADADMVAFAYRPQYYGFTDYDLEGTNYSADGLFVLIIAKHRNGSLGEIPLGFIDHLARIKDHYTDNSNNCNTFVQHSSEMADVTKGITPNRSFESGNNDETETPMDFSKGPEDDLPF